MRRSQTGGRSSLESSAAEIVGLGSESPGNSALAVPGEALPKAEIPWHLSTRSLTRRKKLSKSTGNLHGYMAEDYSVLNWPLPKMFGPEKYGYTLIDIEDPRYVEECSQMSHKLIRLHYDEQIIDLEWRKTYKALLDAEHRQSTLPANCNQKTLALLKGEVEAKKTYLLELQEQRDMYNQSMKEVSDKCTALKRSMAKEKHLEEIRHDASRKTQVKIPETDEFWRTKFVCRSREGKARESVDIFH